MKKFRILEITLRLRYKVFEDYLYHLKTTYQELIQKHCRLIKEKPMEFLKTMVAKGIPVEASAKYNDEDSQVLVNPKPCKCKRNLSIVLMSDDMGRECYIFSGKYWKEELPAPFAVKCQCGNQGPVGYSYTEAVEKWNVQQKAIEVTA